ncbi:MAG: spermidine synthase [Bryobacteraceae bacterium]
MLLYALTIFLSAFLLFQIQPLIARLILPWFGGAAGVWTTCVLFFQILLLGGYAYAHGLVRRLPRRRQSLLHLTLLALSLAALPIIPSARWKPAPQDEPTFRILALLAVTVGLPYFLLSTTGPLIQAWFARDSRTQTMSPYRLYALSNLGSMLALLSYPVGIEPWLSGHRQAWLWSGAYVLFAILCGSVAWKGRSAAALPAGSTTAEPPPSFSRMLLWTALTACASSLLLAVTNHLSQNVAAIPFLWVLPLSLYLLSFILCFDAEGWYARKGFLLLFAVMVGSMAHALDTASHNLPLKVGVPLFATGLFVCCMVCHGELVRLKPHPSHLTTFYVTTALGGALGGLFVGVIAPRFFSGYFEFPITLSAVTTVVLIILLRDPSLPFHTENRRAYAIMFLIVQVGFSLFLLAQMGEIRTARVAVRNFYGGLRVDDENDNGPLRKLTHGTITHGEQYLEDGRRAKPLTYYGFDSGIGRTLLHLPHLAPLHVGVIGLGAGTLAAYGKTGDRYRFYDINPLVETLAREQFYYLRESKAHVDVVLGDARLSLEAEPPQQFDVLAVDAFSSDSIPVHLITDEAFQLYFRHLKPAGILAVHVSNRYLDLKPVVYSISRRQSKRVTLIDTEDDEADAAVFGCTWMLVSSDGALFERPAFKNAASAYKPDKPHRLWTDDYSNLFSILK